MNEYELWKAINFLCDRSLKLSEKISIILKIMMNQKERIDSLESRIDKLASRKDDT